MSDIDLHRHIEACAAATVDAGFKIHRDVGPGLLESVYEAFLADQLANRGYHVERQVAVSATYDGLTVANAFRVDLLIEGRLVVEIKSLERLAPVHSKQLLTYLRLMKQPLGLLLNFGGATFREGIRRMVNDHRLPTA